MNEFLNRLQQQEHWKDILKTSCRINHINTCMANDLTIIKLKILNERFSKIYETLKDKTSNCWLESELKTFNWILLAISGLHNVKIEEFDSSQWTVLGHIFKFKEEIFLKFETKRFLLQKKIKNKNWQMKQKELLRSIVFDMKDKKVQWTEVAHLLFEKSNETYFRTAKHCRQRWLNQLDPQKNRNAWTNDEDLYLFNAVDGMGKKWAQLAALMNRNEHAVKNRFNSLIAKHKKIHPHIKKQSNLIIMIRKQLTNSINGTGGQQNVQNEEEKQEKMKQTEKESIKVDANKKQDRQKDNNVDNCQIQPFEGLGQLQHLVKEQDEQMKNKHEFNTVSPFWSYSPKNITPNGFLSSPSPLSCYMRFSFTNFQEFTGAMGRIESDKHDQKNVAL